MRAAIKAPGQMPVAAAIALESAPGARGQPFRLSATMVISAVIVAGNASAGPLTPFRFEAQAHRHCPADVVVWLDFPVRNLLLRAERRYRSGYARSFLCREEARSSGYRRSPLGLR